jgi:hypothetical protein
MEGPKGNGFWSAGSDPRWRALEAGKRYEVIREFTDFDRTVHPVGERWLFVGHQFLPYDNGLSLFVQTDAGEWHMRWQLTNDEQRGLAEDLAAYIREVP